MSLGDATKFVLSSDAAEGNAPLNRPVLPVAAPQRTAAHFSNYESEYHYREQLDRGRDPRGDDKNLEHCARALHELVRVTERNGNHMASILDKVLLKQTELLNKMSTDARIAELRAVKWEEHAVRLQAELDGLRNG